MAVQALAAPGSPGVAVLDHAGAPRALLVAAGVALSDAAGKPRGAFLAASSQGSPALELYGGGGDTRVGLSVTDDGARLTLRDAAGALAATTYAAQGSAGFGAFGISSSKVGAAVTMSAKGGLLTLRNAEGRARHVRP